MLKKINIPYIIFLLFIFFIFFSFYFILKMNENTKNNYLTIEKVELLNIFDKELENRLSKKLQYLDIKKTSDIINNFENEFKLIKHILSKKEFTNEIEKVLDEIDLAFSKKNLIVNQYIDYNKQLVDSMEKLLSIQAYIQKRYYFSPIALQVNTMIVNYTQAALGKSEYISNINKNIEKINDLKKLYKLSDKQLDVFINSSYVALKYLDKTQKLISSKKDLNLKDKIDDLKDFLLRYFEAEAKKEKSFSYILLFIILCFLMTLIITYEIDKQHKKKLLEHRLKLKEAQEFAHLGSWEIDFINDNIYFSNEMYKIADIKPDSEVLNIKNFVDLIHSDDKVKVMKKIYSSQKRQKDDTIIHKIETKTQSVKYVENRWHNQYDISGNLIKTFGVILDITNAKKLEVENKRKEQIMYQQSKMVAMGEMIGNIAHQWRQPLSVISTSATGVKLQKEFGILRDEDFFNTMELINDNAQYLSDTIDDFKNFIKGDKEIIIFKVNDTIHSFLHLVNPGIKNDHINLVQDLCDNIEIEGHPNELIQCLINIFNNSKDALVEKKVENKLVFLSTKEENDNLVIKFRDNAGGIPSEVLPRIFEPYFTTKHKSQGTGLGLHMTYNLVVDSMYGTIDAHNVNYTYEGKKYKGCEFIIKIPL